MADFILVITHILQSFMATDVFMWLLAAFVLFAVIMLLKRIIYG